MIDRWLYTHQALHGDVETFARILRERPTALLQVALGLPEDEPNDQGAFELPVPTPDGMLTLAGEAGIPREVGGRLRIPLGWRPGPRAHFSTLEGALELEAATPDLAELALFGRCSIPDDTPQWLAVLEATEHAMRRIVRGVGMELARLAGSAAAGIGRRVDAQIRVRDLMTPQPVTLREDLSLPMAAQVLLHYDIGGAPVVTAEGRLIGVFTESDLLAREASPRVRTGWSAREEARRRHATTVGEACSRPAVTVPPEMPVREAARVLHDRDLSRLIVLEEGRLAGILTRHDVLRVLARSVRQLQNAVEAQLQARGLSEVRALVDSAGRVLLTGTAPDQRGVDDAEHAVMTVDGVAEVSNEVRARDLARRPSAAR